MQSMHIKFDSQNPNWTGDRDRDTMFLHAIGEHINDTIRCRGYIYLNQIYELLGFLWNPDDRNPCIRTKVEGKYPFVSVSGFCEPNGVLSAVDIHILD